MSFDTPGGTRGVHMPGYLKPLMNLFNKFNIRKIRRSGTAFGMPHLVLHTLGAKSGQERANPVAYFPGGQGRWLIVASYAGAAKNPAWYYNIGANPDKVRIDIDGRTVAVTAEELHGADREAAWEQITTAADRFVKYQQNTDRQLPILRLTAR
ncbi:nitroreductase family deazaflavin-dependent oxidoreductase [Mycobacterium sp.]|uniref:nitroreductase family deazaflavin-dependent oxidoreductase n=1 Tax=Mycobacterium sp. TaxID=1785 RepID=UPI003A8B1EF7